MIASHGPFQGENRGEGPLVRKERLAPAEYSSCTAAMVFCLHE